MKVFGGSKDDCDENSVPLFEFNSITSVTRLSDLLDFGQVFKAFVIN